jgi:hypothetical protein
VLSRLRRRVLVPIRPLGLLPIGSLGLLPIRSRALLLLGHRPLIWTRIRARNTGTDTQQAEDNATGHCGLREFRLDPLAHSSCLTDLGSRPSA